MPVAVTNTARFNRDELASGLQVVGELANFGVRHGTVNTEAAYNAQSDVLHSGFRPQCYADYLDYNSGPFLPNSQAGAYTLNGSSREWVRDYADNLPGSDRFKVQVNMGGVVETGSCLTIAEVLASDPAVTNSCRWLLADTLDELKNLQDNHKVDVIIAPFHEFNGNWYPWGWEKATHADFISLWQWLATEAHARGLLVAWTISIGPLLSGGLETGSDPNTQRWPGAAYVDVCSLNHYDKVESNRDPAVLLAALQEFRAFALSEGCSVGLGEWGPGGRHGLEHMSNTDAEIDSWPAGNVPGGLFHTCQWNPSSGGPAEGGQAGVTSDEYYDFTRTPGTLEFPGRAAYKSDLTSWLINGKQGAAPYSDISSYLTLEGE